MVRVRMRSPFAPLEPRSEMDHEACTVRQLILKHSFRRCSFEVLPAAGCMDLHLAGPVDQFPWWQSDVTKLL